MGTSRFYEIDGIKYPSVTTILSVITSPRLLNWQLEQASLGRKIGKREMAIGKQVHKGIEMFVTTGKEPAIGIWGFEAKSSWQAFKRWLEVEKPNLIQSEVAILNKEGGYTGTCDQTAEIGGAYTVLDYKSSEHINTIYWLQLAAYAKALGNVSQVGIIRLDKFLGDYEMTLRPYSEDDYQTFLCIKQVWQWINEMEGTHGDTKTED